MNEHILNVPNSLSNQQAIITKPDNSNQNPRENFLDSSATFMMISGGLLFITVIISFYRKLSLKKIKKRSLFETNEKTTCKNCRFFSHNPYLKCALHPSKVSTTESIDCQDYWSNRSDRFKHKTKEN